jgi:hemin uptake protein HemP
MLLRIIIIRAMSVSPEPPLRSAEVRSPADENQPRGPAIPLLRSKELFGRAREILIEHGGGYYRLRVTHSNKLILTK